MMNFYSCFCKVPGLYPQDRPSIGALQSNIRSLAKNHDKLIIFLRELGHNFSLIGLSETKIKLGEDSLSNIDLHGYRFLSQPGQSNAGGVGLFVQKDLKLSVRNELSVSDCKFEALWVDIALSNQKIICAIVYQYPNASLEIFTDYPYASLHHSLY